MPASPKSPAAAPWPFFATHRRRPFAFFIDRGIPLRASLAGGGASFAGSCASLAGSGASLAGSCPSLADGGASFAGSCPSLADGGASFAGSCPSEQLVVDVGGGVRLWRGGAWHPQTGDPIDRIADFVRLGHARAASLPNWLEGQTLPRTVGFLAYELGRWADGRSSSHRAEGPSSSRRADDPATPLNDDARPRGATGTPLAVLSTYDEIDAWDPRSGASASVCFESVAPRTGDVPPLPAAFAPTWTTTTRETYRRGFERIREAIAAGDIYQANLSRRAVFELDEDAGDAYSRLREVQPVPWGAFLDFGGFSLLSNSPECFLVRRGDSVSTQPIKGTRPRRDDAALDAAEVTALGSDPKEMAEHLMIVDLERSDLGRVARTGSVEVTRLAAVESFATVHHMVSDVHAALRDGTGVAELLRATFPGGSITGAPKIRAMQILEEVEEAERGPYTGAIGFFHGEEKIELSIAIRTAIASGSRVMYSAGGGIVADSDPDREWDETELKLAALKTTLAASPGRQSAPSASSREQPTSEQPSSNHPAPQSTTHKAGTHA